jgi:hypothetical protein
LLPRSRAATARHSNALRIAIAPLLVAFVGACATSGATLRTSPTTSPTAPTAGAAPTTTAPAASTSPSVHPRVAARVSVWGDSLSVQAKDELRVQGRAHDLTVSVMAFFGLAPCDVTHSVLQDIARSPDALALAFSGNNFSPCMQNQARRLTGAAYYAAYRRDIGDLVAAAVARGIPTLVVGAPAFPSAQNVPDRVELNTVLREVAAAHPGARYVESAAFVSPNGFTRTLPCLPGETAALGCQADGRIIVRVGNGIHFDDVRTVPCPSGHDVCNFTAGGHRYANAILAGLATILAPSYVPSPPDAGVPSNMTRDG